MLSSVQEEILFANCGNTYSCMNAKAFSHPKGHFTPPGMLAVTRATILKNKYGGTHSRRSQAV